MRAAFIALLFTCAACGAPKAEPNPPPAPAAAPMDDGPPNTTYRPAFPGQTRAPELHSGINLSVETIAEGLDHPWSIQFLPDGRALVSERAGRIRIVAQGAPVSAPLAGVPPVDAREQGGLLDLSISPNFAADRLVYWSYAEPRGAGANSTSVARARLSDDAARLEHVQVIFRQEPPWRSAAHFGSRLAWDRAGHLFVTMGERFLPQSRVLAQDLSTDIGKVVRLNADGSIPADNPFVGRAGARPEIWSYGHRNVQGADINPETGKLWTIEHGPRGGDEINVPLAGRNYGWPIITYGIDYDGTKMGDGIQVHAGMEQPIYYWDPVIAPSGVTFYRGALFPWRGDLLIAALRGALVRVHLDGERVIGEERLLTDQGRIRDVQEAADGALWVVTDDDDGRVLRLTPAP